MVEYPPFHSLYRQVLLIAASILAGWLIIGIPLSFEDPPGTLIAVGFGLIAGLPLAIIAVSGFAHDRKQTSIKQEYLARWSYTADEWQQCLAYPRSLPWTRWFRWEIAIGIGFLFIALQVLLPFVPHLETVQAYLSLLGLTIILLSAATLMLGPVGFGQKVFPARLRTWDQDQGQLYVGKDGVLLRGPWIEKNTITMRLLTPKHPVASLEPAATADAMPVLRIQSATPDALWERLTPRPLAVYIPEAHAQEAQALVEQFNGSAPPSA